MSNQLRRIGTGLVLAPVVVGLAYAGGIWFGVLAVIVGAGAQVELYGMSRTSGASPNQIIGLVLGAGGIVWILHPVVAPAVIATGLLFVALSPFLLPQERFLDSLTVTLLGAVYPTGLLGSLVLIREARSDIIGSQEGFWLVLMTLFLVWATDIFAYYTGRTMGRHKLAPVISPNKTWEGAIGGVVGAGLVGIVFKLTVLDVLAWPHLVGVVAITGGLGQLGDLVESQIKRSTGTKDAGSILPGHGGLLDRVDSVVVAAPLVYVYLDVVAGVF